MDAIIAVAAVALVVCVGIFIRQAMGSRCPHCGQWLREARRYCPRCGADLD